MDSELTPSDRDAELGLLSCIISGGLAAYHRATADGIAEASFAHPDLADIWQICARRASKGFAIGLGELKSAIRNNRPPYASSATLAEIVEAGMTNPTWSALVGILQDRLARRIASAAAKTASEASGLECIQILQKAAQNASEALSVDHAIKDAKKATQEFIELFMESRKGANRIDSGILELDARTTGLKRGGVWVFGGTPGRGKSVLLFQIAEHCIWAERNVLVFSLELMTEEVISRILTAHGTASANVMQGKDPLTKQDTTKIKRDVEDLASKSLAVCDKGGITIDEIEAHAARLHDRQPLDLIVLDYIQLCEVAYSKGQSREQQVAQVSRRLKAMAKRFNCGVITASQLNDDGRMRESRAIKQDADAVFLIKLEHGKEGIPALVIDKLRGADPGNGYIRLALDGSRQKFL